jgi:acetylcholinesterase
MCVAFLHSLIYQPSPVLRGRWGESAGAISVALQMVTNGGNPEGLFRGGFMESGSPTPATDITTGQTVYNQIVNETGCAGSPDTLDCLRELPFDTLAAAINKTPDIFNPVQVGASSVCFHGR